MVDLKKLYSAVDFDRDTDILDVLNHIIKNEGFSEESISKDCRLDSDQMKIYTDILVETGVIKFSEHGYETAISKDELTECFQELFHEAQWAIQSRGLKFVRISKSESQDSRETIQLKRAKGCLIGGAIGDAFGYCIEFSSREEIEEKYGKDGLQDYELTDGVAVITDDTQMTLFTAEGLFLWEKAKKELLHCEA